MAVRVGMAQLIARVRLLIDAPVGDNWNFSPEQIQEALDRHRQEFRYLALDALPTKTASSTTYLTFQAPYGDWETTTTLYNYAFAAQSPATSDYITGRWTFSSEPTRPVYLVGFTYDRYAAAGDLLDEVIAMNAGDAAKRNSLMELSRQYKRKRRVGVFSLERSDLVG